jgi:FtsP/CotA-like multicopper oxidase with cupredoxin domain
MRHVRGRFSRRELLRYGAYTGAGIYLVGRVPGARGASVVAVAAAGPTLDPTSIDQFVTPLTIPPAMPRTAKIALKGEKNIDYYEIAVRQFEQQVLPVGMPKTAVWGYGSLAAPGTFNYPSFTIEAKWQAPVRVKWVNDLGSRPHLLPVDPTLHWANPPGPERDMRPSFASTPRPYTGPVPLVTHLHGAEAPDWADGYAEAWYLAQGATATFTRGTWYDFFKGKAEAFMAGLPYANPIPDSWRTWSAGNAIFQYSNDQRAATLWYHDHTLGMTRLNVYAGPAGFFLLRGGPGDDVGGTLPGPAPALGDPPGTRYYEIPLAIQDRSFDEDGSLFYPDARAFFEGLNLPPTQPYLDIPFIGEEACDGAASDVSPIWQPEFFGTTMLVNGATWPSLEVEQRRYRFRLLNGCNGRFLILKLDPDLPFWQIGAEGGFLPAPVKRADLLMSPAERADVIVDFSDVPVGAEVTMINLGPDEPFGGGKPDEDFDSADPETTGRVMRFRVVRRVGGDRSTAPDRLVLPARAPLGAATVTRKVSLNEAESSTVRVSTDNHGNVVLDCADGEPFAPVEALLGTVDAAGEGVALGWDDTITENPDVGAIEVWAIHNFTVDAHPIHVHELQFEVVNRESLEDGHVRQPEPWEKGLKDTVIAYPGEITRIKLHFDEAGQYVWHCHLVEHEDNEMMRPYSVGPQQTPS